MAEHSGKKLGLWTSTSLVVGSMIASGIFLMPAALARFGSISLVGWVFAAIGAMLTAWVLSKLSVMMPVSDGGPYAYCRKGMGDFAGFCVAWSYWLSTICGNAAITVGVVSALSTFFPSLANNSLLAVAIALAVIWLLGWINTKGIIASGRLQLVTTLMKIIPLLLVTIGGLFFLHPENFHPFNTSGTSNLSAISATATLTFFSFLGLECATIPSGSIDNPGKVIPRATMLGAGFVALIYIMSSVSVMGVVPSGRLQESVTPYADAAVAIYGSAARYWISAGVAIAAFGALNGYTLVMAQISSAIAADGLFPEIFCRKNRNGAPAAGIVIGCVLVSLLMMMNYTRGLASQYTFFILLTTIATLVPFLFSAASFVILRSQKQGGRHPRTFWPGTFIAGCTFLFLLWAIGGSGQESVFWGFILLMAGVPFYVGMVAFKKNGK
jgi:APA family basic amino acid/polyamine antiporter